MSVTELSHGTHVLTGVHVVSLGDAYELLHRHLVSARTALEVAEREASRLAPGVRKVVALATMASLQGRVQYLAHVVNELERGRPVPELGG